MSQNTVTVHAGEVSTSIKVKRPKFDDLVKPYNIVNSTEVTEEEKEKEPRLLEKDQFGFIIKDRTHCIRFKKVHPELYERCLNDEKSYQNTCATRMSYAFNHGGYKIKSGEFNDIYSHAKIFASVSGIIKFLKRQFGASDIKFDGNGNNFKSKIQGKKGIIVFQINGWNDATGHVTLWDGSSCVDGHCYFTHMEPSLNTTNIIFWELK